MSKKKVEVVEVDAGSDADLEAAAIAHHTGRTIAAGKLGVPRRGWFSVKPHRDGLLISSTRVDKSGAKATLRMLFRRRRSDCAQCMLHALTGSLL